MTNNTYKLLWEIYLYCQLIYLALYVDCQFFYYFILFSLFTLVLYDTTFCLQWTTSSVQLKTSNVQLTISRVQWTTSCVY